MDHCSELSWLSEMGLENSIFTDHYDLMDTFDEEIAAVLGPVLENCLATAGTNNNNNNSSSSSSSPTSTLINNNNNNNSFTFISLAESQQQQLVVEPPTKIQKPNDFSSFSTIHHHHIPDHSTRASSTPIILNFGNANSTYHSENPKVSKPTERVLNREEEAAVSKVLRSQGSETEEQLKRTQTTKKTGRVRPPSQTYDHIIAERKRREQLSQRFVALSTIVPGLKKMDKTSVLGDAIKYLKHLQERVKTLEEQATKQTMESVVLVKKSQIMLEDEGSSDEKSGTTSDEQPLPEIEARVCNNHILLRIHCEKQKGVLVNLLSKVEKLNLAVINTNVTPFGSLALDITIVAEMEKDFSLTVKEVVTRLRAAL